MESKGTTITPEDADGNYTYDAPKLGEYADNPLGAANSQSGASAKPDIVTVEQELQIPASISYEPCIGAKTAG